MTNKIAYLTIDDSPSNDFRNKVDFLAEKNIPCVFFCRGDLLQENPDDTVYAIQKGFVIGNHAFDHPKFSEISFEEGKEQIVKTDAIIEEIYSKAGVERTEKYFRFPYGDRGDQKFQEVLAELGYTKPTANITYDLYNNSYLDWFWTYDVQEWNLWKDYGFNSIEEVYENMNEKLSFPDSEEIILIHDHVQTSEFFQDIINKLLEKIEFKPIL